MTAIGSSEILFVGSGHSALSWYRCGLPSLTLACDYVGVAGPPERLKIMTALKRGDMNVIDWDSYRIIVLQQPHGTQWLNHIRSLQRKGIKVLYEIDDYVHGVRKVNKHSSAKKYTKRHCAEMELCMKACDGLIVTTDWLAQRYRKFNKRVWVCRNAIEGKRYSEFQIPDRGSDALHVGWAGGEGHWDDVVAWMPAIERILDEYHWVKFGTIGKRIASVLPERFADRIFELPFVSIENYPGALMNFDICIAPAGRNDFFKGKSDLRWLECAALGIPTVCDPFVYHDARDRRTALLADGPGPAYAALAELINDARLREMIATEARKEVLATRSMEVACEQWINIFRAIA